MPNRPRRTARIGGYALIAATGVAAMLWPPPSISHASSGPLAYTWAWFLVAGGVICAAGAGSDVWLGEYVGLWPLIAAFAIFGFTALATGHWVSVAGGCCLLAVACWLMARWQDVAVLRREATRDARSER